jgi:hypothetical protein
MMAMTTSSSTKVKPVRGPDLFFMETPMMMMVKKDENRYVYPMVEKTTVTREIASVNNRATKQFHPGVDGSLLTSSTNPRGFQKCRDYGEFDRFSAVMLAINPRQGCVRFGVVTLDTNGRQKGLFGFSSSPQFAANKPEVVVIGGSRS